MIFKQFYLGCLAHASYLIGDTRTGTAVIVDPRRDVQIYLDEAAAQGLTIRHVFLTHLHADFIAGHLELRDRVGAQIHLGSKASAEYRFVPMADGDTLEFGAVRLQALETPGHTPESISIAVFDLEASRAAPYAVLTGDTLFIGDVGRPDLRGSLGWPAETLGRMLYRSLHDRLLGLPDSTLVYPAHGAGSLCGKSISKETVSTLGDQRRSNYALQPMSEDAFVALVTADQPDAPAYFTYDAVLNARERPSLDTVLERELKPLALAGLLEASKAGAQILDVREPGEFAQGHLTASVNVGLGGQYATWAGTLLSHDRPIVIVASPGREHEAATRLGRIGFDNVAGYLDGGMQSVESRPDLMSYTRQIDAGSLATLVAGPNPPLVVDVRTSHEWDTRHIEGARNIPLSRLTSSLDDLPRNRELVVHCAGGYRSSIAISLLQRAGFESLSELTGGIAAWNLATS
jgi:glyoxylase-like metal-dependent hydrolase (beta-lactamase superfamily II)/rhodanese-related sulfurtransferase